MSEIVVDPGNDELCHVLTTTMPLTTADLGARGRRSSVPPKTRNNPTTMRKRRDLGDANEDELRLQLASA